jgi:RNA-directed DNA polymerase
MSGDVHVRFCERLEGWFLWATLLVVLHPKLEIIQQCKQLIENWLLDLGLELKPSKTRITHTLYENNGNQGFDPHFSQIDWGS